MQRTRLISVIGLIVLAGFSLVAALRAATAREKTPQQPNMQALLARVEKLEARVAQLERHRPVAVLSQAQVPSPSKVPEGWTKKEFNGIPYYIVPLQGNDRQ